MVRGPQNARALLHASFEMNGQKLLTWSTGDQHSSNRTQVKTVEFFPWPRRHPMTSTEPLIFSTWALLMSKVAIILREPEGPGDNAIQAAKREQAKHQARGIAEVLAIQMQPFMESADHVVKCAVAKYRDENFEVPGLGEHLWDPMFNADGTPRTPIGSSKKAAPKKAAPKVNNASTKTLTAKEAEGIKEAVGSGMFTKEDVASMFDVSLATIEQALGS